MCVENLAEDAVVGGRDRLMRAAAELFRAAAYREVSVAELTRLSGVQAPTLYYHFKDKEGLYVAWALQSLAELGSSIADAIAGKASTRDQLAGVATALLESKHLDLLILLRDARLCERTESQERIIQAYLGAIFEPLGGIFVRGMERGKLRQEPIARMTNSFVLGALSLGRAHALETIEPEDAGAWWARRFLNGFGL